MSSEKEIREVRMMLSERLRNAAKAAMYGTVKSVDEKARTCDVQIGGIVYEGVLLYSVEKEELRGRVLIPKKDSTVIVARIDAAELEAARALSLRLWANIGLISDKPYLELEKAIRQPVARAFAREEHERVRARLSCFHEYLTGTLYRVGAMDDRQPQKMILREVLGGDERDEVRMHLARRYLWASYDCMDYSGGVMLIHPALAEPQSVMRRKRRAGGLLMTPTGSARCTDILPEEIPLQREMERAIAGALRDGQRAEDVATTLRLLCKQGAPLDALEDVLQTALIIYVSDAMRAALSDLYFQTPKWVISAGSETLQ